MRDALKIVIACLLAIALFCLIAFSSVGKSRQFSSVDAKPGNADWLTKKEATE